MLFYLSVEFSDKIKSAKVQDVSAWTFFILLGSVKSKILDIENVRANCLLQFPYLHANLVNMGLQTCRQFAMQMPGKYIDNLEGQ